MGRGPWLDFCWRWWCGMELARMGRHYAGVSERKVSGRHDRRKGGSRSIACLARILCMGDCFVPYRAALDSTVGLRALSWPAFLVTPASISHLPLITCITHLQKPTTSLAPFRQTLPLRPEGPSPTATASLCDLVPPRAARISLFASSRASCTRMIS